MKRLLVLGIVVGSFGSAPAQASFHLWQVSEVYTNADQSVQFVEFFTTSTFQQFLINHQLQSLAGGEVREIYTFPTNLPLGQGETTADRHFLFATPGFEAVSGIAPDYEWTGIGPFISLPPVEDSAVLILDGLGLGIANLPTDGSLSLLGDGVTTGPPTPINFAGDPGTIVPEPAATAVGLAAVGTLVAVTRACARRAR